MKAFLSSVLIFVVIFCNIGTFSYAETVHAESVAAPISLGFKPNDTAMDPNKPVIYMTKLGSKTIYAVNYSTGVISTLTLPYPAERLKLYNDKLYVTQHKMSHDQYNFGPYSGAIAEVDTQGFKLSSVMDVDADPYDIAIDENGFIYISPGSGQWQDLMVYSLKDKTKVPNSNTIMRSFSYLNYDSAASKVYAIDTDLSPRDVDAFEVKNGKILNQYDSPYHGDYPLEPFAKITPDGESMYNNSGVVFGLTMYHSGDMNFQFKLGRTYNDYEFSLKDQLTFAARVNGGVDVFKYGTNDYVYSIRKDLNIIKLHYQNGLVAITTDNNGKYFVENISLDAQKFQDPPGSTPVPPVTPDPPVNPNPIKFTGGQMITVNNNGDLEYQNFYDGVKNVRVDNAYTLTFDQPIQIDDESKISIEGPEGLVDFFCDTDSSTLYLEPDILTENKPYILTIKKDAISGNSSSHLANDLVIHFQTKSNWEFINGKWHYYSPDLGGNVTGWNDISGIRYYFNNLGEMQIDWNKINNKWYYFNSNGAMVTGWLKWGNSWYYLNDNGDMKVGWLLWKNQWYYFDGGGAKVTGWLKSGSTWYYLDGNGVMVTGWQKLGNSWYYFNNSGDMKVGWLFWNNNWYYLDGSGAMKTGWVQTGGKWYYFYSNGAMAYNTKIGGYRLGTSGAWIK